MEHFTFDKLITATQLLEKNKRSEAMAIITNIYLEFVKMETPAMLELFRTSSDMLYFLMFLVRKYFSTKQANETSDNQQLFKMGRALEEMIQRIVCIDYQNKAAVWHRNTTVKLAKV